jgi:hypothetical protein
MYNPEQSAWSFQRDEDGVPGELVATLFVERQPDAEHWDARVHARGEATEGELREVAEFAAWAGQGSDVWFRTGDIRMVRALVASGYRLHVQQKDYLEYTYEWPPHTFEPPKERT